MQRIVIHLSGGVVQGVYARELPVEVVVVDTDSESLRRDGPGYVAAGKVEAWACADTAGTLESLENTDVGRLLSAFDQQQRTQP